MATPFMEHPSGEFDSAVDAMADAIRRLRALPEWSEWITFCAQGMGHRMDSYHMAEIRVRRDELELDKPLDVKAIIKRAGVPESALNPIGANYSIRQASPDEAAKVMNAVFRNVLGIRPHTGEGDDYAIGAEW
ncbi:MAG TPA: hypothetical protein VGI81_25200 [Tepidisphaeraceae bacterium]|jgi:hypothetical protein